MNNLNVILLGSLGLILAVLITRYSARKIMMLQYPFLVSAVVAGWVLPQLIGLGLTDAVPPEALAKTTFYVILCVLFGVWGYGSTRKTYRMSDWQYSQKRLEISAAVLMLAGAYFYQRYSALSAEATLLYGGFWTGMITIYVFLSSMLTVGFILVIAAYFQKPTIANRAMIAFGLLMYLQRVVIYGRREAAMELFVIASLFVWRKYRWVPSRWLFVGAIVFGALFVNATGAYRSVMIDREAYVWSGAGFSDIANIDFWGLFVGNFDNPLANQELKNAALTIDAADRRLAFDGGLSFWNHLVFNFVPGQIVGYQLKQDLMFVFPDLAYEEFGHIPWAGTTQTGFSDSFRSFWYFGAFVYFAIGFVMRRWFTAFLRGSQTALMVLMLITSQSLIAITHTTQDFFSIFVNLTIFMLPALVFSRTARAAA